jgi:hypothetical protein
MSKKIGCVVYYTDDRYDELAKNVKNSFLAHNGEECDYHQIDYTNQEEYNNMLEYYEFAPETFLMQFIYANISLISHKKKLTNIIHGLSLSLSVLNYSISKPFKLVLFSS